MLADKEYEFSSGEPSHPTVLPPPPFSDSRRWQGVDWPRMLRSCSSSQLVAEQLRCFRWEGGPELPRSPHPVLNPTIAIILARFEAAHANCPGMLRPGGSSLISWSLLSTDQ